MVRSFASEESITGFYFLIASITLIKPPHIAPVKDKAMQIKRYLLLFSIKPHKDVRPRIWNIRIIISMKISSIHIPINLISITGINTKRLIGTNIIPGTLWKKNTLNVKRTAMRQLQLSLGIALWNVFDK